MLRSSRSKWVSGIGAVVLSGGLLVAGYGTGILPAEATITFVNPFPIIIDKLNQILAKLSTSGGGGGNHTLRWDSNLTGTLYHSLPRGGAGQQYGASVGTGARCHSPHLAEHSRFLGSDELLCQQECRRDARLAAAVGGGVGESG